MIPAPRLIVFTDLDVASGPETLERVERAASVALPRALLVVLRDKHRSARERAALGSALRALTRRFRQSFGVAERLDLALLLGADAVHLGEASVDAADARGLLGGDCFVTRACHDPERCAELDADGVVLSPVMSARKGRPALGPAALGRARELAAGKPVYALGGVDASNAALCVSAGAAGAAVIGAVLRDDPEALLDVLGLRQRTAERNHS